MIGLFKPKHEKLNPTNIEEDSPIGYVLIEIYKDGDRGIVAHCKSDYPNDTSVIALLSTELEVARLKMLNTYDNIMANYRANTDIGSDFR